VSEDGERPGEGPRPEPVPVGGRARLFREGMWVGVGQVGSALGRFVGMRLVTTYVSPAVYGEFALLQGVAALGSTLFCSPLVQATLRFFPDAAAAGKINGLRRLAGTLLRRSTTWVVIGLLVGGAAWTRLPKPGTTLAAFALVAATLALDVWRTYETALMNASRNQRDMSAWNTLDAWVRPIAGVLAVWLLAPDARSVLLGFALGCGIVNLIFWKRIVRAADVPAPGFSDPFVAEIRPAFVRYAVPLVPLAVLSWIISLAGRYFVAWFAGEDQAGIFAAIQGLVSQPFMTVGGLGMLTLRPVLYDAVSRGDRARERRTLWVWLAVVGGIAVAGAVLATLLREWVVALALGKAFRAAADLMPWLAWGYTIQTVQTVFEAMIYSQHRTGRLLAVNVLGAATSLLFFALLIPPLGARGAVIAMALSFSVSCSMCAWQARAFPRWLLPARAAEDAGEGDRRP
jgi:O-antigen/teichoic acid export membrane protein